MNSKRKLAIVGLGPRGLFASERLIFHLANMNCLKNIQLLLFEKSESPGNGSVYNLSQSYSNWLNLSERVLEIPPRAQIAGTIEIPFFPSYHAWINSNAEKLQKQKVDVFPPRSKLGEYLKERFQTLIPPLEEAGLVQLYNEEVSGVSLQNGWVIIETQKQNSFKVDEVLLTIGHQPTQNTRQIKEWINFSKQYENIEFYPSPYPLKQYLDSKLFNNKNTIGIRGFGLAMIDVVRGIAEKFGDFVVDNEDTLKLIYRTKSDIKSRIFPFSLDGLPMAPKPINKTIDNYFTPTENQLKEFERYIGTPRIQKEAESTFFLIQAFADIASEIFYGLKNANKTPDLSGYELKKIIINWLEDPDFEHRLITPKNQNAEKSMHNFVEMATDKGLVSLDYCVGQVWRHCQPSIYKQLSHNACVHRVFAEIIKLDERMKRYAFGPPVASIQQLLALIKTNIVNLKMVNNPEIELTKNGWKLSSNNESVVVQIMINSVLEPPAIKKVDSPLVKKLLTNELIQSVHDELGAYTDKDAYILSEIENKKIPIAILGRLAKGTIIGVDAILECFGKRPDMWAKVAAEKHSTWLSKKRRA